MLRRLFKNKTPSPSRFTGIIGATLKALLLVFPIGFFVWFLSSYFVLSGQMIIETDFCSRSPRISPILPWNEVGEIEEGEECFQSIYGPLMTFDVKAPRWFEKAKLELEFDPLDQPVIDVGFRRRDLITVDERPAYASVLEHSSWRKLEDQGMTLFQKEDRYQNVGEFFNDRGTLQTASIATYHVALPVPDMLPAYRPQPLRRTQINKSLRGSHKFTVYLKDEPLDLIITKQDLNRYPGRDPLLIRISTYDKVVDTIVLDDDGVELGGGTTLGPLQTAKIFKEGMTEGPYNIELMSNDDVVIRSIDSGHELIVFHRRLFLADNIEYFPDLDPTNQTTSLVTNGSSIQLSTSHPNGLQTVTVEERAITVDRPNDIVRVDELQEQTQLSIPKNDLLLETDGLFAFGPDQWFEPIPDHVTPLDEDSSPTLETIDYAIARYSPPERIGRYRRATYEVDLKPYLSDDYQFRVHLILPQIDERKGRVNLGRIKVTLTKPPVTLQNAWERASNVIRRSL